MNIIDIHHLNNAFDDTIVHQDLDFSLNQGEIMGVIGASGSGKTTLLRNILMLMPPQRGSIKLFGIETVNASERTANELGQRFGVMFQNSALFSNLSVLENILFPLQQFAGLDSRFATEVGMLKLSLVGLPTTAAHKLPAELSGGMLKRAAAARAIALDPELLFLDEPTAGLDPESAVEFCNLIVSLKEMLHLTVLIISHDLTSLEHITDRVAFLGEAKVLAEAPLAMLKTNPNPAIQAYFGIENEGD